MLSSSGGLIQAMSMFYPSLSKVWVGLVTLDRAQHEWWLEEWWTQWLRVVVGCG